MSKLPTIQDLNRDELLVLVSIALPEIKPALLLRVQINVAGDSTIAAYDAAHKAFEQYDKAHELLMTCNPGSAAERKARRASEAARDAWQNLDRKAKRIARRWDRLSAQFDSLSATGG